MGSTMPNGVLEQVVEQRERLSRRMESVERVVAVVSGKGGVGKSTLVANLAAALADRGWRVGALDADLGGPTLAQMLGARGQTLHLTPDGVEPGVGAGGVRVMSLDLFLSNDDSPVKWRHPDGLADDTFVWQGTMETSVVREMATDTIWGDLDMLLIDFPPGTERFSTFSRLIPKMFGVTVTIPSEASYLVVNKSVRHAQASGARLLGLLENMAGYLCPTCEETGPLFAEQPRGASFAAELDLAFLGSIPFDPHLTSACNEGLPLVLTHPGSPAAVAMAQAVEQMMQGLEGQAAALGEA
jgi:ATP-binding protein involved in chromosome partitioning